METHEEIELHPLEK